VIAFSNLFTELDQTTKTTEKVDALVRYFQSAPPEDAAWAISFLIGRKPKQAVAATKLRAWAAELAGIPEWLMDECYDTVGDAAETVALILPQSPQGDPSESADPMGLRDWVETRLLPLRGMPEEVQKASVIAAWQRLDARQRFVWNKLITGGFRVGVSQLLVTRALANVAELSTDAISHRLMGDWSPTPDFYRQLLSADASDTDRSRPYPFFLAHPLDGEIRDLGEPSDWQAEWKWDGIRAQLIRREGQTFLWTRGEELVTDRYPELQGLGDSLPDGTAIDGEILPWKDGGVLPFGQLQKRIGRKTVGKKILEEIPVVLMAYDAIEIGGVDRRESPLQERRPLLRDLVATVNHPRLIASPTLEFATWEALATMRAESRSRSVEGVMLKRLASPYRVGRVTGDWWKWKIDPFTVDAVLIYAQKGHGKRANLYTDYTFGVWQGDKLVTIAKAYSGLSDAEIKEVDAFVRANTLESFGPVRTVKPQLVFELGFEGIQESTRHKSGIAVRFPRMLRRRTDKTPAEADTLEHIRRLIRGTAG
jgi:DNA ligase 1